MVKAYQKDKREKKFRYKEDRDTLQRGIQTMTELLQWAVWLLIIIASILFVALLGCTFYLLAIQ